MKKKLWNCHHVIFSFQNVIFVHKFSNFLDNLWNLISQQLEELETCSSFLFESSFSALCGRINTVGSRARKIAKLWESLTLCRKLDRPANQLLHYGITLLSMDTKSTWK